MTLWRVFARDPAFAVVFYLLVLAAWCPLSLTPILPFADLHNNAGAAALLHDVARGGAMSRYYEVNWSPVPYWTGMALLALFEKLGGILFAAKAVCALLALLLPLAIVRLLVALDRDPRLGLWAFLLTWDRNLYAGWVSYLLGMSIALFAFAWLIEVRGWRSALRITAASVLVALTHPQAIAYLAVGGAALCLSSGPVLAKLPVRVLGLSGGLVAVVPWVQKVLEPVPEGGVDEAFTFDWHSAGRKADSLFDLTFGNFDGDFDTWPGTLPFVVLCLGPLALASLPRTRRAAPFAPAFALVLSALLLYAVSPFFIGGPLIHKHNYVRYATFVLAGLLLVPRPRLTGRAALALVPGIAAALAMDWHVAGHMRYFAGHARPFTAIMALVRPGSRVLPVVHETKDPGFRIHPYAQFHSYATGRSKSYDPLFFNNPSTPLLYKKGSLPPWPGREPSVQVVKHYDYVLVQGLSRDPFRGPLSGAPVRLVREAGMWRLYVVAGAPR